MNELVTGVIIPISLRLSSELLTSSFFFNCKQVSVFLPFRRGYEAAGRLLASIITLGFFDSIDSLGDGFDVCNKSSLGPIAAFQFQLF